MQQMVDGRVEQMIPWSARFAAAGADGGDRVQVPAGCREIADQLAAAKGKLADAYELLQAARGSQEHQAAARRVDAARAEVLAKHQELDACRGCAEPITAAFVDRNVGTFSSSDGRIGIRTPLFFSYMSFRLSGCDHEFVEPDPGRPEYIGDPFGTIRFTIPRRFPDVFGPGFPPPLVSTPYTVSVRSLLGFRIEAGRYDRATGHLDLTCSGRIDWYPTGGPASWLNGFYGLDFRPSRFHPLMTTRSVPKEVPPLGPTISGAPRPPGGRDMTLVCSARLSGGFGDRRGIELLLPGVWGGRLPVGP